LFYGDIRYRPICLHWRMRTVENRLISGQLLDSTGTLTCAQHLHGTTIVDPYARKESPLIRRYLYSQLFTARKLRIAILTVATFAALC